MIILSTLSHGVSCVSLITGMVQVMDGGQSYQSLSIILLCMVMAIFLNGTVVVCLILILRVPKCTAEPHAAGVVVKRSTAGIVGVSFEDSLLSTLLGFCGTLWVVSSAFRNTAFSSDTLECRDQSLGSLLSVFLSFPP